MENPEIVFAIHDFQAQNEDEINLIKGECIIVIEKDELYNDGWWKGQNSKGQIGLFPMNFINPDSTPDVSLVLNNKEHDDDDILIHSDDESNSFILNEEEEELKVQVPPTQLITQLQKEESLNKKNSKRPPSMALTSSNFGSLNELIKDEDINNSLVLKWNSKQVSEWVQSQGFDTISSLFIEHNIEGKELPKLTLNSLKDIGILAFGKRFNLLSAISNLLKNSSSLSQQHEKEEEEEEEEFNNIKKKVSFSDNIEEIHQDLEDNIPSTASKMIEQLQVKEEKDNYEYFIETKEVKLDLNKIILEGYLKKQETKLKIFRKKYCILYLNKLEIYSCEKKIKLIKSISLLKAKPQLDPNLNPGSFCFKITIPYNNSTKYYAFSSDNKEVIQAWMKQLMKIAIDRDLNAPVVTSCSVDTIPLNVARKMAPRPPSTIISNEK